jgi:hypothetical protein
MHGIAGRRGLALIGLLALWPASCSFDSEPIMGSRARVSPPSSSNGGSGQSGAGTVGSGGNAGAVSGGNGGSDQPAGSGGSSAGSGGHGGAGSAGSGNAGSGGSGNAGSGGSGNAGSGGASGSGGTGDAGSGGSGGTGIPLFGCANPLREGSLCDDNQFCTFGERCHNGECTGGTPTNCSSFADSCNTGECDEDLNTCKRVPARENETCSDGMFCTTGEACHAGVCGGGIARDCSDAVTLPCHVPTCDETNGVCAQAPGRQGLSCDDGLDCTHDEVCDNGECSASVCTSTCQAGFDCNIECHGVDHCDATCDQSSGCMLDCAGVDQCALDCKGTQCGVTCQGSTSCAVNCSGNATCQIDCRGSDPNACSAIVCDGSACSLICDPGDNCGFDNCKNEMICADGSIVCGQPCPMKMPP